MTAEASSRASVPLARPGLMNWTLRPVLRIASRCRRGPTTGAFARAVTTFHRSRNKIWLLASITLLSISRLRRAANCGVRLSGLKGPQLPGREQCGSIAPVVRCRPEDAGWSGGRALLRTQLQLQCALQTAGKVAFFRAPCACRALPVQA